MKIAMHVTGVEAIGDGRVAVHAKSKELWNWATFAVPMADLHKYVLGHTVEVEVGNSILDDSCRCSCRPGTSHIASAEFTCNDGCVG